ncbi:hypothetical protein H0H92_005413 [Tricholoma furcatifolium]|nr:hypothetical protein H0H92_005413 [Tricholoma furcatifolium]
MAREVYCQDAVLKLINDTVIRLPLQKNTESVANLARRKEALKAWDERRERAGLGAWNVVYGFNGEADFFLFAFPAKLNDSTRYLRSPDDPSMSPLPKSQVCDVQCKTTKTSDVHIPIPSLRQHPNSTTHSNEDDLEDWNADMAALFEWVGMANLSSQRLRANDRVDPYVAVYEHPAPSYVGSMTHLRWTGLIGPGFLQSVVDTALTSLKTRSDDVSLQGPKLFIAVTAHACSTSPVTYISSSASTVMDGPARLARADGEDAWSLIVTPSPTELQTIDWALVETLGQYDARWG